MIDIIQRATDMRRMLQEYFVAHADEDKTTAIVCSVLFDPYVQEEQHNVGDIRLDETGVPFECITAYDGAVQTDWTIHTATLWKPYHSTLAEYALPWIPPTGTHDIYKVGEYMVYSDGNTYKCIEDTNFDPDVYAAAWENLNPAPEPEPEPTPQPEPEPEPEPTPEPTPQPEPTPEPEPEPTPEPEPEPTPEPEPEPTPTDDYPVWEQPDASNPYSTGDRVHYPTIEDAVYESTMDGNVWSPETYPTGWQLVTE